MKNFVKSVGLGLAASILSAATAQAVVVSTNGSLSSKGVAASIIAAPSDVRDDAAYNQAIQAFNEIIGYTLTANLAVDGGLIAAGTRVDSHMIFLNSGPGNSGELIEHGAGANTNTATFTFDGIVLGVMSDSTGSLEVASSSFLGALGTIYPGAAFTARGMESGAGNDWYSFAGSTISLGMRVTEPGDWIRVVTVSQVPIPASLPLLVAGLGAFGLVRRRKHRKA